MSSITKVATLSTIFATLCAARPLLRRDYAGASDVVNDNAWFSASTSAGSTVPSSTYQCYNGNVDAYPTMDDWLSFDTLWSQNEATISSSNGGNQEYVGYIQSAITQVAQESQVDPRLILAVTMQESTGNANVQCTGNGNCGLMQGPIGSQSLDPSNAQSSIVQMIQDGVQGTSQAPGFSQYMGSGLTWVTNPYPGNPYAAARGYNSGNVASSGNLDTIEYGTESYSNDIANRLLGWTNDGSSSFASCGS